MLLQWHFEEPGGDLCYLETHDEDYIGHFKIQRARLEHNLSRLELPRREAADVEVTFKATKKEYDQLVRMLRIMMPRIEVVAPEEP